MFQGNDSTVNLSLHSGRCLPLFGILPWKFSLGVRYLKPTYKRTPRDRVLSRAPSTVMDIVIWVWMLLSSSGQDVTAMTRKKPHLQTTQLSHPLAAEFPAVLIKQ